MDYNEDPDPPNHEADEWHKEALKLRAELHKVQTAFYEMQNERNAFVPQVQRLESEASALKCERDTYKAKAALLDAPEIHDFAKAVVIEAAHQRSRWGTDHDEGKTDADWFWLIGFLAGKALHSPEMERPTFNHTRGDSPLYPCSICRAAIEKQLHRIITVAAAACNWHAARLGKTNMRPGIATPAGEKL